MRYALVEGYLHLKGYEVEDICKKLGISRRTWRNKVNGASDFSLEEAVMISNLVGDSIDSIFLRSDVSQTIHQKSAPRTTKRLTMNPKEDIRDKENTHAYTD